MYLKKTNDWHKVNDFIHEIIERLLFKREFGEFQMRHNISCNMGTFTDNAPCPISSSHVPVSLWPSDQALSYCSGIHGSLFLDEVDREIGCRIAVLQIQPIEAYHRDHLSCKAFLFFYSLITWICNRQHRWDMNVLWGRCGRIAQTGSQEG